MSKPVIISCDSACDLNPELREQYNIQITHMYVHEGDRTFRDGLDICPDDIYRTYEQTGVLPMTAAIPPEGVLQLFPWIYRQGICHCTYWIIQWNLQYFPGCGAGSVTTGGCLCTGLPGAKL